MIELENDEKLIYMIEVLRARLEIRNFFLKTAVKEVYENIGQVLSLVRMQLANIDANTTVDIHEKIDTSGNLIGQSIRDLRLMSKNFYPDVELMKEEGLIQGLEYGVAVLFPGAIPITEKGIRKEIEQDLKLILFKTILQILEVIKDLRGKLMSMAIVYLKEEVKFELQYKGKIIEKDSIITRGEGGHNTTLQATLQLINSRLKLMPSTQRTIHVILISPLKIVL